MRNTTPRPTICCPFCGSDNVAAAVVAINSRLDRTCNSCARSFASADVAFRLHVRVIRLEDGADGRVVPAEAGHVGIEMPGLGSVVLTVNEAAMRFRVRR